MYGHEAESPVVHLAPAAELFLVAGADYIVLSATSCLTQGQSQGELRIGMGRG